jgi:hypothetical protein
MDDPERGVLKLVRIIAVAFLGAGVVNVVLYILECSAPAHRVPVNPLWVALESWPAIIGIICLVKSKPIASWLSDLLDL